MTSNLESSFYFATCPPYHNIIRLGWPCPAWLGIIIIYNEKSAGLLDVSYFDAVPAGALKHGEFLATLVDLDFTLVSETLGRSFKLV